MLAKVRQLFIRPSPLELAIKELCDAEHSRLEAQSATEYANSVVLYNDKRIARLIRYINESTKETS